MPGRIDPLTETGIIAEMRAELARLRRGFTAAQSPMWEYQDWVLTGTPPTSTYTLNYLPYGINHVSLNGLTAREGVDYTIDYAAGVLTFTATKTAGDILSISYVTTGDLTAASGVVDVGAAVDNFNRASSATTLNPASDGGTWAVDFGGVFGITSNTAYNVSAVVGVGPSSGPNVAIARRDVGQAAMEVIVDVTRASTAGGSVIVACYDPATTACYEVVYDSSSGFGSLNSIRSDGHATFGVFVTFTAWTGGTTSLKLRADSAGVVTIYQLVSGSWVSKGTATDPFPLPGTWAGFGTAPTSPGADNWDNFSATPI